MRRVLTAVDRLNEDRRGAVAIIFALLLVVVCGAAAIALDFGRALSIKTKLQSGLDAAVLAGASVIGSDGQKLELANRYVDETIKKHKLENFVIGRSVAPSAAPVGGTAASLDKGLTATVAVRINTYFGGMIGYKTLDVAIKSEAAKLKNARVLDLAMCIDATGSMQPTIDAVKNNALSFYTSLNQEFERRGVEKFSAVRIRPIFFRDFGGNYRYNVATGGPVDKYPRGWVNRPAGDARNYGDDVPLRAGPDFFNMVNQSSNLSSFVTPETESGGGDDPESGLECLNEAMNSKWLRNGDDVLTSDGMQKAEEVFSVIAIWTDQDAQPPSFPRALQNPSYPPADKMPRDYAGLAAKWRSESAIPQKNKLFTMFMPHATPITRWQPVMAWDRFKRAGSLTEGTSRMVNAIVDAVMEVARPGGVSRLSQ